MILRYFTVFVLSISINVNANALTIPNALVADGGFTSQPVKGCQSDLHYFNQVSGWQIAWPAQWETLTGSAEPKTNEAIKYWSALPQALEKTRTALETGIDADRAAPHAVVSRVQQQVQDLSIRLAEDDPRYYFANDNGEEKAQWNHQTKEIIAPAIADFALFLDRTYLPSSSSIAGLSGVKGGRACFEQAAVWWTTLSLTTEEIEQTGKRLLELTKSELLATSNSGENIDAMLSNLRDKQAQFATTAEELSEISRLAVARAADKVDQMFNVSELPDATVEDMPLHMQASAPAGFYRPAQGNQLAAYIINPSRPGERRLMAEVITFHETIPGHHLYSTYPRKKADSQFNAGIAEGWAIYAEYLADELNLYSTALDRQGMIAKHLWAASRLIVEPGLHLHGWSREDAIQFMMENTAMSQAEIEIEVDRYLALPGQSLSYMLGADLMMRERHCAETVLGETFDIKEFHDVILSSGARPLPAVQSDIRNWVMLNSTKPDSDHDNCEKGRQ